MYLCWTCVKDRRCKSEEHRYLRPHAHEWPLELDSLSLDGHRDHKITQEDWDTERADAEAK